MRPRDLYAPHRTMMGASWVMSGCKAVRAYPYQRHHTRPRVPRGSWARSGSCWAHCRPRPTPSGPHPASQQVVAGTQQAHEDGVGPKSSHGLLAVGVECSGTPLPASPGKWAESEHKLKRGHNEGQKVGRAQAAGDVEAERQQNTTMDSQVVDLQVMECPQDGQGPRAPARER